MSIGRPTRPIDWESRSLGTLDYTADIVAKIALDGHPPLIGAILRSPHPYARILSIDTSAARRIPGVHAVITMEDFEPGIRFIHRGGPLSDRPPLADGIVRHVGQEVAAVAAESTEIARAACRAITVRYRTEKAPLTVRDARKPGARRLHDRGTDEANVSVIFATDWGDFETGAARSTVSTEGSFSYPSVSHAAMETNTTLASWDAEARLLNLWTSTQAPWFIAKEVSHLLGLDHDQVVCREVGVGGGFGSKSKASEHEVLAGALSMAAGRAVLVELTRAEEFGSNKPRHRFETALRTMADADGTIRALEADILTDNGSYNHMGSSVMRVGAITLGSMYRPDGVRLAARLVDTATQPGGQFRGYGTPQVSLASESQIDELAERLGIDPLELRLANLPAEYTTTLCGYEVTTNRLGDCLIAVRDGLRWDRPGRRDEPQPRGRSRGLGVAAGMHGSGAYAYEQANRSDAAIDLFTDGTVRVRHGGADAGTGQNTILAQIAAYELGVELRQVAVLSIDAEHTPFELGAWSSRGTHMTGSSVGQAAREFGAQLREMASDALGVEPDSVRLEGGYAVAASPDGGATRSIPLGRLVGRSPDATIDPVPPGPARIMLSHETSYILEGTVLLSPGMTTANLSPSYAFAAHGAEVEVDRRTGKVRVVDYVAAHDVGQAINPTAVAGQIVGGAAMGLGAALGEELVRDSGRVVNSGYLHYAMPRNADLPSIRAVIVEGHDDAGPYGAKSVGEMSIVPPGAAIANAVYDAIGVRIRDLPITPDKVLIGLAEKEGRPRRRHRIWRRPTRWWVAAIRASYPLGLHEILHRFGTPLGAAYRARHSAAVVPEPEVLAPSDLEDAAAKLAGIRGAAPIGGATDAIVERRRQSRPAPVLISLAAVSQLRGMALDRSGGLRIGSATTLAELAAHPETPLAVAETVEGIASAQIRNAATVGGNLAQEKRCWFFRNGFDCYKRNGVTSPCYAVLGDHRFQHAVVDGHRCQAVTPSDLGTVFLALDAVIEIASGSQRRRVPMAEFYTGPGETCLKDGEMITAVTIPAASLRRTTAFTKLGLYEGDFATASVALSAEIDDAGVWGATRIVLGAMAPTPWRLTEAERALRGTAPDSAAVASLVNAELDTHAHPLPDNAWKLDAAVGLVETAVELVQSRRRTAVERSRSQLMH